MSDNSAAIDGVPGGGLSDPGGAPEPAAREQSAADLASDIGRRLAAHRAARGMRVADLAREVGVTPSLISQIERGQSRPSVTTLFALAQALDLPVDAFFREPQGGAPGAAPSAAPPPAPAQASGPAPGGGGRGAGRYVVRRGGRAVIDMEGGVRWERLTRTTNDHLDFFELVYAPGASSHPRQYTHPGTEMVVVLTGIMEITVGFDTYRLEPGDSIDFPSSMPHRYVNAGAETARAITVILYDCPGDGERAHPAP